MVLGRVLVEEVDCEGKSSFLKMSRFKFSFFRWFLKKGVEFKEDFGRSLEDEEFSVVVDVGSTGVSFEVFVLGMEVYRDMFFEEDGEEKRVKTFGFGILKFVFFRMKILKAGADLL